MNIQFVPQSRASLRLSKLTMLHGATKGYKCCRFCVKQAPPTLSVHCSQKKC